VEREEEVKRRQTLGLLLEIFDRPRVRETKVCSPLGKAIISIKEGGYRVEVGGCNGRR